MNSVDLAVQEINGLRQKMFMCGVVCKELPDRCTFFLGTDTMPGIGAI
jgi:hypothetical protein